MVKSKPTKYANWEKRYRRGKKIVSTYVDPTIKAALAKAALRQKISVAEALRDAIDDYLNGEPT